MYVMRFDLFPILLIRWGGWSDGEVVMWCELPSELGWVS